MNRVSLVVALAVATTSLTGWADEPQGTLKKIIDSKVIRLGYQKELRPFSFAGSDGKPKGYSIELCHRIVAGIRNEFAMALLDVEWIEVTLTDRFQRVADGTIDLECAASAITLSRLKRVDFSAMIWIDSKSFLVKRGQSVKNARRFGWQKDCRGGGHHQREGSARGAAGSGLGWRGSYHGRCGDEGPP